MELTPAQKKRLDEKKAPAAASGVENPVTFDAMFGLARKVMIGETEYDITPFSRPKLPRAGQLVTGVFNAETRQMVGGIPEMTAFHAMAAAQTGAFCNEATAALVRKVRNTTRALKANPDADEEGTEIADLSADAIALSLTAENMSLTEQSNQDIADLIALNIRRKCPEFDAALLDDLESWDEVLDLLRHVFGANPGFCQRF